MLLDILVKEFPTHTFSWVRKFNSWDFAPRFSLVIDDKETKIQFNPELVQDLFVAIEGNKLGLDPFDIRNLMIPFTEEKLKPIFGELTIMYVNEVKKHFYGGYGEIG